MINKILKMPHIPTVVSVVTMNFVDCASVFDFWVYSFPSFSRIVFYRGLYKSHNFSHMAPPRDCLR